MSGNAARRILYKAQVIDKTSRPTSGPSTASYEADISSMPAWMRREPKVRRNQALLQKHAGTRPTYLLLDRDVYINRAVYALLIVGTGLSIFEAYNMITKSNKKQRG
ncbi:uncharacterized protein LOC135146351 isoform X2 [Zophobas morio]|uniref:uncharacterized protein LOC135146351 isoform X2 n=1 Tax=Zophobas morio TaxID=2755281 RepID=UPI00308275CE